ncbi:outer membrane protein [Chlorobium sp.]|jgi:opacity protein-like surface antigen|uniref:outer membrane protein n=1 Tax=Chlorobium sp. TaxID=1095 RepID=UPI003C65F5ED|nr:porin family protein [Chlorobiaceae bacterium]
MTMMFRGLIFLFSPFFFLASPVLAATPYVGGSKGFAFPNGEKISINGSCLGDPQYDTGAAFSGVFGKDYDGYRLGGEVAYQKNEIDNLGSDVSVFSVIANGYLNCRLEQHKVTPFLSAGLSYAKVSVDALGARGSDGVVTLQLGAGVGFQVSSGVTIDAKYRYFAGVDPGIELGSRNIEMDIDNHNFLFGLRAGF